jgi:hypothetical protein
VKGRGREREKRKERDGEKKRGSKGEFQRDKERI